ncbi:MAG: zinc ABC transporter substrate-binding protein, partial [Eubacteriales bacterium]|nr:zinc ABC transporter substrate-binding protein [Eubacteriales bacterium]
MNRSIFFRPIALLVLVSIAIGLFSSGCATEPAQSTGDGSTQPLTVAVGIVPLASFVTAVGGEQVKVVTMIPPGNSPANYQPSNLEMQALSDASLYLSLQTPTEKANILPKLKDFNSDINLVDLQQAVGEVFPLRPVSQSILLGEPDSAHADAAGAAQTTDHHVWLSPKRAIVIIERIEAELIALDPAHAAEFQANAQAYITSLQTLDQSIRDSFAGLKSRDFLIYHGSYAYFAEDYELNMISIELAGKEATAAELKAIIDYA